LAWKPATPKDSKRLAALGRHSALSRKRSVPRISDATVIVEASCTSGSLHQAAECLRSDRWLFIMKSVAENRELTWPRDFIGKPKVVVMSGTKEILDAILK
jgi:predicted Rossmann fold nucleotide-binding protein DprA/Smf involved in DNA uptake